MRLTSKGIDFGSHIAVMRGSFMTLALTRSRCARDLKRRHVPPSNDTVEARAQASPYHYGEERGR